MNEQCALGKEKPLQDFCLSILIKTTRYKSSLWEGPETIALNILGNKDPSENLIKVLSLSHTLWAL